jgi:two-component system, OmpR family, osmolarity sensor histidine kinase EnvZ
VTGIWSFLRRILLPRRLFARALLILVAPIVLLQAVMAYLFLDRHEARTTEYLTRGVASEIALVIQLADAEPSPEAKAALAAKASRDIDMDIAFMPGEALPEGPSRIGDSPAEVLRTELSQRLKQPFWFDYRRFVESVDIRVALQGGTMRFVLERKRFTNINMHLMPVWTIVFSIVFIGVAVLFLANQIRPIQRLAAAAEAFGRGREVEGFKPQGATEVRQAAVAFIDMRRRIARQIQQRTEMLAGVSHDLRTPLTRMKLELAMMPETPECAGLRSDLAEMEHMLEGYLAFARGETGEAAEETDLADLVRDAAAGAGRSAPSPVKVEITGDLRAPVKRGAMKRCLANLVENALRYGGSAALTARRLPNAIEIAVDDNGPGIPANLREEAFKPFRRLDEARNLDKGGGVGLGLAIARDIARSHGGDVTLSDSPLGGLRAAIRLPV